MLREVPRIDRLALLTILMAVVILTITVLSLETRDLVKWSSDDGFYYLKVARNISTGNGSTFDEMNLTNGYHPLWMGILIPISWLLGDDLDLYFRTAMLLERVIFASMLLTFWQVVRRTFGSAVSFLCILVFFWPRFMNIMLSLLETSLVALLVVLALRNFLTIEDQKLRTPSRWKLGFWLALILMARLDVIFVVGIAVVITFLSEWQCRRSFQTAWYAVFPLWLPPFIVGVTYLSLNLIFFDHPVPISGSLKTSFPYLSSRHASIPLDVGLGSLVWIPVAVSMIVFPRIRQIWAEWGQLKRKYFVAWLSLSIGATLHLAWTLLFMDWAVFNWHFVVEVLAIVAGIPIILDLFFSTFPHSIHYAGAMIFAAMTFLVAANMYSVQKRYYLAYNDAVYDAARYVAENTPADTVFAMKDSGVFGYFSNRRTVNLDGVINSFDYQEYLRDGRLAEFLDLNQVSCLAQHAFIQGGPGYESGYMYTKLTIRSHMYEIDNVIDLHEKDEVYRSAPYNFTEYRKAVMLIFCPEEFEAELVIR